MGIVRYIMGIVRDITRIREISKNYVKTIRLNPKKNEAFKDVRIFCMFLGYPRSGHSLVGSLLDAHQNVIIAHELGVLDYIKLRFTKEQIFFLLVNNSAKQAAKGRTQTGYSYVVPGQHQGKFSRLMVIGDKKGGESTLRIKESPELIQNLVNTMSGIKIKYIHVYRNPFDNITTWARGGSDKLRKITTEDIKSAIDSYFESVKTISNLKSVLGEDMLDVKHEDLIDDPKKQLIRMCEFLGIDADKSYVDACASIVFKSPNKSRRGFVWTLELIKEVENKSREYDFLSDYSFQK